MQGESGLMPPTDDSGVMLSAVVSLAAEVAVVTSVEAVVVT